MLPLVRIQFVNQMHEWAQAGEAAAPGHVSAFSRLPSAGTDCFLSQRRFFLRYVAWATYADPDPRVVPYDANFANYFIVQNHELANWTIVK